MTFKEAKQQLAERGIRIEPRNDAGEFRVTYRELSKSSERAEAIAYYDASLDDAFATGVHMANIGYRSAK